MRVIIVTFAGIYIVKTLLMRPVSSLNFQNANINQCGPRSSVFLSSPQITLNICMVECIVRPTCRAINYRRSFPLCELLEDINSDVQGNRCLFVKKSYMNFETGSECYCKNGQKSDSGYNNCTNSDCSSLRSIPGGHVFGNLYTIGSVLKVVCDTEDYTQQSITFFPTCESSGNWSSSMRCQRATTTTTTSSTSSSTTSSSTITTATIIPTTLNITPLQWQIERMLIETVCPKGWHQFLDSCFYISTIDDGNKTASIAKNYCEDQGAHLSRIDTEDKSNFITSVLSDLDSSSPLTKFWIGLRKSQEEWIWMDNGETINFTNWGLRQPNSYFFNNIYVYIETDDEYRWHDIPIGWNSWICEMSIQ